MARRRGTVHLLLAALIASSLGARVAAQGSSDSGAVEGTVSTQAGAVRLPGVLVSVRGASETPVAEQVSDEQGHVRIPDLPPGRYRIQGSLDGFQATETVVSVAAGETAAITLDLPIAAVTETVDVVATASPVVAASGTLAAVDTVGSKEARLLAPGESVQSSLRLLATVISLPGGASISGGRPNQVGNEIQHTSLVDPATGLARINLPVGAVESVSVLPNPYEVEFGGFGSGVVVVETRRAADRWKTQVDNVEPAFRLKRFTLLDIKGISVLKPSVETGGPLGDGLFLEQTAQYHFDAIDIPSRPENELRTTQWFSTFSRIDAKLSTDHSMIVMAGLFPGTVKQATLGTFTPPASTADIADHAGVAALTERAVLGPRTFLESTLQFHEYVTDVHGQLGGGPMMLLPETTLGPFFNRQHRRTGALQWLETISATRQGRGGQHFVKAGLDVLYNLYDGTSASAPTLIERSNGTLARRLDFDGPTTESARSLDAAAFVQDRVQPGARWYFELGARVERDGLVDDDTFSPRLGTAILLNRAGSAVLRGGYGLFYERTPLVAGAFEDFETPLDTRYAADGVTPLGPSVRYTHTTAGHLHPARSATWDVEYEHRLKPSLAVHAGYLSREGRGALIVDPEVTALGPELLLTDEGQSSFRQADVGVHVSRGQRLDINATYVRSSAREDLNSFVSFFDIVAVPVVAANAYAAAAADAPNRLFVRGRAMPTHSWMLVGTFDWRDGLPYSIVNDDLDFIGPRNDHRFPMYVRLETGLDRRLSIARVHPWLGLRVTNALNSFLPADVQAHVGSPAFGSFANSEYRQYRIHLRFER